MARRRTVLEIDAEIDALKRQRQEVVTQRSAHIGKLAAKAGLVELDVTDAELLKEFEAIAARLQEKSRPASKVAGAAKPGGTNAPSAANAASGS